MNTTLQERQADRLQEKVAAPIRTVKIRVSFEEAYNAVLANSKIRQVADGKLEPSAWATAVAHDVAAANKFLDNFVEDINLLTNPKNRFLERVSFLALKTSAWENKNDKQERAKSLWVEFQREFANITRTLLGNIKSRTVYAPRQQKSDFCVPLTWVKKNRLATHICNFEWADSPTKVTERRLIDWCYKSPEDFTRKVPTDVTDTLKLLKTTHYDWFSGSVGKIVT